MSLIYSLKFKYTEVYIYKFKTNKTNKFLIAMQK